MSEEEKQSESYRAAKLVFSIIGVNIEEPKEVEEFREDLRFGRDMRKMVGHGKLALAGAVALGMAVAVWQGIISLAAKVKGG